MTIGHTLVIYRHAQEGRIRAAELRLPSEGPVEVTILEPSHAVASFQAGVGSNRLKRKVTPAERELYLEAVKESLARSTYWSAIEE
jgi:hypothetical protein